MPDGFDFESLQSFAQPDVGPSFADIGLFRGGDRAPLQPTEMAAQWLVEARLRSVLMPTPELREPQWELMLLLYLGRQSGDGTLSLRSLVEAMAMAVDAIKAILDELAALGTVTADTRASALVYRLSDDGMVRLDAFFARCSQRSAA